MELASFAVLAVLGDELAFVTEGEERVRALVHAEDDIAASAAVAAVWAAVRHILLTVKGDGAVPAVARLDIDLDNVDKHG